jgi:hypothetical protein
LVDAGNHPDAKQLVDEAAAVGMPLHHLVLEDTHCRTLYQDRLVLVRPDLHIAWSGHAVTDAAGHHRARPRRRVKPLKPSTDFHSIPRSIHHD